MRPLLRLVPAALLAVVVLVSCSDDGDDDTAGDPTTGPSTSASGSSGSSAPTDDVPSTVLRLEPGHRNLAASTPGPGVARTRAEGAALLGRFGLDPDDEEVLAHLDTGEEVVVAALVGDSCDPPTGAVVAHAATSGLDIVGISPPTEEGLVCDAFATATVVLALAAEDVPPGTEVEGSSDDNPTGVGVVHAVVPVDEQPGQVAAWAQAPHLADALAAIPGAPTVAELDLPPADRPDDAWLLFVVDGCMAEEAELVADVDAGAVTAEVHQAPGPETLCEVATPYLVVATLDPSLSAELDPVPFL